MCSGLKKEKKKGNRLPGNDLALLHNASCPPCFCQDHLNVVAALVGNLPRLYTNKTTTPP